MIANAIAAIIGNYYTSAFILGLIVAAVQIARLHRRTAAGVASIFLNTYLLYAIGVAQIINFVMHSFFGDYAAKTIGWAQSPFQLELAFCSLGLGVAAILVHGQRTGLTSKLAVVLATAIAGYGAAGGHVYQLIVNHDHAANNSGLLLIMDIVISTAGLVFVIWTALARRRAARAAQPAVREVDIRELTGAGRTF
jgi:hypothetical protein